MRAYDLAMTLIFINCAFPIINAMGIALPISDSFNDIFILNALYMPIFTVGGVTFNLLIGLAIAFAAGTVIVVGTNLVTDRGLAMTTFTITFWGSFAVSSLTIMAIIYKYPGFTIFWSIFLLASVLIFVNALVQFPTGGQGAHV